MKLERFVEINFFAAFQCVIHSCATGTKAIKFMHRSQEYIIHVRLERCRSLERRRDNAFINISGECTSNFSRNSIDYYKVGHLHDGITVCFYAAEYSQGVLWNQLYFTCILNSRVKLLCYDNVNNIFSRRCIQGKVIRNSCIQAHLIICINTYTCLSFKHSPRLTLRNNQP